jgi:type IV pilus assembly protein PilM
MTQKVIGLDLGSSSVKAAVVHMGIRGAEILRCDVERVETDDAGGTTDADIAAAAGRLVARLAIPDASIFIALPGETVSIRRMTLPASIGRRAEQVMRFELDEQLPYDIEDAVFHSVALARRGDEVSYLAMVARTDRLQPMLETLSLRGIEPREVAVSPWILGEFFDKTAASPTLVVNIGHTRTDVTIVGDSGRTCRTILRGGKSFTGYLAEVGKISFAEA